MVEGSGARIGADPRARLAAAQRRGIARWPALDPGSDAFAEIAGRRHRGGVTAGMMTFADQNWQAMIARLRGLSPRL